MKVRITDLLDQYEDDTVRLMPAEQIRASEALGKEIIALQEKKHRFGWREGLAAVGGLAAVAALVLFATGVFHLRSSGGNVGSTVESGQPNTTEVVSTAPGESEIEPTLPVETPDTILLTNAERAGFNARLTKFSEQGWTRYDAQDADEYQLVKFAHQYYKINDWKQITYMDSFETLRLEQVNDLLSEYLGKTVSPTEGTDYTAQQGKPYVEYQHEQYHDGLFWFPAADGDMHTLFTVCDDAATQLEPEEWKLEFRVYDGGYDVDKAGYANLSVKAAEELVKEGELELAMCGMAILRLTDNGWLLQNYEASFVEEPSGAGEHSDDWEEEWPAEYPVENWKLLTADGASVFTQTGELNAYRYEQLPAAENYKALLQGYLDDLKAQSGGAIDCGTLETDTETMHDGYANHFSQSETAAEQSASLSGSSVTGRFSFSVWPGAYAEQLQGRAADDRERLEEAAWSFVRRFEGITGELALTEIKNEPQGYSLFSSGVRKDLSLDALTFRFVAVDGSRPTLSMQDGLTVPVTCGDSTLDDLSEHSFTVTVLADGTVAHANNYITTAAVVPNGSTRMIDESDLDTLVSFLTSTTEDDVVVFTQIAANCFSVYFGSAEIEPTISVWYYFESDPGNTQITEMVLPGLFD